MWFAFVRSKSETIAENSKFHLKNLQSVYDTQRPIQKLSRYNNFTFNFYQQSLFTFAQYLLMSNFCEYMVTRANSHLLIWSYKVWVGYWGVDVPVVADELRCCCLFPRFQNSYAVSTAPACNGYCSYFKHKNNGLITADYASNGLTNQHP